ncbi:MAG: 4'-phosphopantetheinyl transferase superfamily protein [Nitrospiraceae bacterium]|nr:MAG: 4'-phosphopantetheinyl transferase superfamily protein [Nitrospiraceae bacterium]
MMKPYTEIKKDITWLVPPGALKLYMEEVHVWRASLNLTETDAGRMQHILSPEEKERSERFHFQKDRDHFIASRGLLRMMLSRYLGMEPYALRFCTGTQGKPSLLKEIGGKEIRFSVSHSRDLALFAFTRHMEIGVDLEYIRHDFSTESIPEQVFSQNEFDVLNELPLHERQKKFFSIWVRKEALLKALGTGLSHNMNQYDVISDQANPSWSLRNIDAADDYAGAIAVMGHNWKLTCFQY